ncbi:MAG: peptidylprolyl isomerase [Gammaproteobacteria bacterium]|nr:peptidylprolyl isomerase [Gammaproteobacteria bacterium]
MPTEDFFVKIAARTVALFDYTLTDAEGNVLDSSKGGEPLAYLHGAGNIIPGLEKALEGKGAGDSLKVTVPAAEAYGERDEQALEVIQRTQIQMDGEIEIGMQLHAHGPHGAQILTVVDVDGEEITLDANHPLAGVDLTFDVSIVEVRDASVEELAHGHVHGAGGHHH